MVVNLSYGFFAGPHDGTSPIEDMFEKLIALAAALGVTLRIMLPAGNSYLSRTHAEAPKAMFVAERGREPNAVVVLARPSRLPSRASWRSGSPIDQPARGRPTALERDDHVADGGQSRRCRKEAGRWIG